MSNEIEPTPKLYRDAPLGSTPDKYLHDPMFRQLVDQLTVLILRSQFSPSELREASVFAAIRYEEITARRSYGYRGEVQ